MLTETEYQRERAICDKAKAYWEANATYDRSGWSSMSQELASHTDYAACDNAMRGRVEQYEILRDLPETIVGYVQTGRHGDTVTTWTGEPLGTCRATSRWLTPSSYVSTVMYQFVATIGCRTYTGRCGGNGLSIMLRETAESKRRNPRIN